MKIITWNLANYDDHPHWDVRLKLLASEIVKHKPDVIALQEVRFNKKAPSTVSTGWNTAEQLLAELYKLKYDRDAYLAVEPAMFYTKTGSVFLDFFLTDGLDRHFWEGLAVISKEPIIESNNLILNSNPPESDKNIRNAQIIRIGRFRLVNTHLSYNQDEAFENIKTVLECLKRYRIEDCVICGDFNVTPDNPVIKLMEKHNFVSVGEIISTHPSSNPLKKLDYFFVPQDIFDRVISCSIIGTEANEAGIYPSDHLGLLLEIDI
ncbi:MAG: endonuclease/exonuclease/phosphatase family protein [Candidatus Cloacimonetes bacterium]|nr:endonuclease/exonuclease/phosphatase family protein [Candidatus Cloacimonadota bacterium]